jgi:DNA-binding response OmpR family regulator
MEPTQPILLVDDDESYRLILRHHLEALGYEVLEADDGAEGCRIASSKALQLIILDIVMPDTEGLETIRRLRRAGVRAKILAVSGAGRAREYLGLAGKLGADAEMEKVRPISELLSVAQSLAQAENPAARSD